MASDPLRVVVAGLGRHATKTVLPALAASERWVTTGVVSLRPAVAAEVGAAYGVAGHSSLVAAIEEEEPDAVYVAAVPSEHVAACQMALSLGVQVIVCEKPLGTSGEDVRRLITEAETRSALLYEVMAYQHHPQFVAIEDLIGTERIGDLVHGYASFMYPHLPDTDHRYDAAAGGGATLDAGFYPLSMAVRLLGGKTLEVQASLFAGDREVDTAGAATLTDGRGRYFQCSWGMGAAYTNLARIVGTNGIIEVARPFSKPAPFVEPLTVVGGWGERAAVPYPATDQFVAMLDDIARHRVDLAWIESTHRQIEDRWSVIDRVLETKR